MWLFLLRGQSGPSRRSKTSSGHWDSWSDSHISPTYNPFQRSNKIQQAKSRLNFLIISKDSKAPHVLSSPYCWTAMCGVSSTVHGTSGTSQCVSIVSTVSITWWWYKLIEIDVMMPCHAMQCQCATDIQTSQPVSDHFHHGTWSTWSTDALTIGLFFVLHNLHSQCSISRNARNLWIQSWGSLQR